MVAPNFAYVAVRPIDYVVMADGRQGTDDEPWEWHRVRVYNPGDPVSQTAVIGDPEAEPNAWLNVGPDVVKREDYPPKAVTDASIQKDRGGNTRLGRKPAKALSE
jgi:hypothetical protein